MKTIITSLFVSMVFVPFIVLHAQEDFVYNHPKYYQDGDCWMQALVPYDFEECIQEYEMEGYGQNFSLYSFYVKGDTIIDNKEYKCVHAKTWIFDCEKTDDYQPKGLIEGSLVTNVLFMREDAEGKQWRRLAHLKDEALLFDFSHPFEEGQLIRFCKHCNLSEQLDIMSPEESYVKAYSAPNRPDGVEVFRSDVEAPQGYIYFDLLVSDVTTIELPNGETVPCANGHIAFGLGDITIGDLWHQFVPDMESLDDRFLYRVHQGQVLLQHQENINRINRIIGTDVLTLFIKKENNISFTAGQVATIILPIEPEASKGKYYRLDRVEDGKIIFEQELQPRAHVPYIIVPDEDFSIDLSTLDLAGCYRDTVSVDDVSFIGSYVSEAFDYQEGFYIDIIDTTPDCRFEESCVIGALRAYLLVRWDDPYNQGGTKVPPLEKLEVVLHDNGTGINNININDNGYIYDLQGRKLPSKPVQGVYIEDGKMKANKR